MGHGHSVVGDHGVYAWGVGSHGQLGHQEPKEKAHHKHPHPVDSLETLCCRAVLAGGSVSGALSEFGQLYMWGEGEHGQLGNDAVADCFTPQEIKIPHQKGVRFLSIGPNHSLAISQEGGSLYAWGHGANGRLGLGPSVDDVLVPTFVSGLGVHHVVQASCGLSHSAAVTEDGLVFTWGNNKEGQLGLTAVGQAGTSSPTQVTISPIAEVSCGYGHTLARNNDGRVFAWGSNEFGQLGTGVSPVTSVADVSVSSVGRGPAELACFPAPVTQVVAGGAHSLAITLSGDLFSWGRNGNGELGHGHFKNIDTPKKVENGDLVGQKVVTAGSCGAFCGAICASGHLYLWGNPIKKKPNPTRQLLPASVKDVAIGNGHYLITPGDPRTTAAVNMSLAVRDEHDYDMDGFAVAADEDVVAKYIATKKAEKQVEPAPQPVKLFVVEDSANSDQTILKQLKAQVAADRAAEAEWEALCASTSAAAGQAKAGQAKADTSAAAGQAKADTSAAAGQAKAEGSKQALD